MKKPEMSALLKRLMLGAAGLSTVALGTLALAPAAHAGTLVGSKHDLGNTGITTNNRASAASLNGEICVFCHTPHAAATSAAAPLWNKTLPTTAYSVYNSPTMSAINNTLGAGDIQAGTSIACLSCHDGTQAMDILINAPGSGGFSSAGGDAGFTWSGPTVNAGGTLTGGVALLGGDLRNDHPIGIFYCGNTGTMTSGNTTNCSDADFVAPTSDGVRSWWVNVSGVGGAGREKTDMILYARADNRPRVECGSCHDPHNGGAGTQTFLRVTNQNSRVCLACHVK
jgi:predicted CXXCH cytochrome family protein